MSASPEAALHPMNRSTTTFFDWFSEVTGVDFVKDQPDKLRGDFASRGPEWFADILSAYRKFHEEHPGGYAVPQRSGRRPLVWDQLGTAGHGHTMGGIGNSLAFFGPLFYEGIVFTDGIALPMEISARRTRKEIMGSIAQTKFLDFVDRLINYAPLYRTGQLAVISEDVAFAIAKPQHSCPDFWGIEEVEQDLLERRMNGLLTKEEMGATAGIPFLLGYLNLAESYDLDPVISQDWAATSRLLHDYFAQAAFSDIPENAYSRLPELKFYFHLSFSENTLQTPHQIANLMVKLVDDEYWVELRRVMHDAAKEATRADFNTRILDGVYSIHKSNSSRPPAYVSLPQEFGKNLAAGSVVAGLSLASFIGTDDLGCARPAADFLLETGGATVASAIGRKIFGHFLRRPFVAPDVLREVAKAIHDPHLTEDERNRRNKMREILKRSRSITKHAT